MKSLDAYMCYNGTKQTPNWMKPKEMLVEISTEYPNVQEINEKLNVIY